MKTKHFMILVAVLVFGLVVEGLKGLRGLNTNKSDKIAALSFRDMDSKPFFISQSDLNENSKRIKALGGRAKNGFKLNSDGQSPKNILSATAGTAKKETTVAKAVKKKKKKKKPGRGRGEPKIDDVAAEKYPETEKEPLVETPSAAQQFITQLAPATKPNSDLPISYEDWAKLILGAAQPENVNKLIEFYNNNMVSADIFYSILNAMLEETNPEQHKLAVYAASNAPNAYSFTFLVQVVKSEAPGSKAASKAYQELSSYRTLESVAHLKAVLSMQMSDVSIIQMAVNVLDKSTEQFLENRATTANSEMDLSSLDPIAAQGPDITPTRDMAAQAESPVQTKSKVDMTKAYAGFIPVLEKVIETYKANSAITEPAKRSLSRIQKLTVVTAETKA